MFSMIWKEPRPSAGPRRVAAGDPASSENRSAVARGGGEPVALLLFGPVGEDVVRYTVVDEGGEGTSRARELLHDDRLMGEGSSTTAVLHGHVAEQHPHGTSLRPCVGVREPLLAPPVLMWREFGLYERADSCAERPQRVTRPGRLGERDHAFTLSPDWRSPLHSPQLDTNCPATSRSRPQACSRRAGPSPAPPARASHRSNRAAPRGRRRAP